MEVKQHHKNANKPLKIKHLLMAALPFIMGVFLMSIIAIHASAQSINVSLNVIPPYSPYYADYYGVNANKVLIIAQNLTNNQVSIKLTGQLTGLNNGVKISTYNNYVPLKPIILNPHQTLTLNGMALKDILDINNVSVSGIDKGTLIKTSRLPEGDYNFCLQAYTYNGRQLLSQNSGCTSFTISYPDAPVLIGPIDKDNIYALTPQNVVFNWLNPGAVPVGTQYTLQMAEMPFANSNPDQVLNAAGLPILNQTTFGTSYIYNINNVPLKYGSYYAWRVIAKDPMGKVEFKNGGISKASSFVYSQTYAFANANTEGDSGNLFAMAPSCQGNNTLANPIPMVVGLYNNFAVSWLWKAQINKLKTDSLNGDIYNNYTQLNTSKGSVFIYKYTVDCYRNGLKLGNPISFTIAAPDENVTLKYTDVLAKGFVMGGTYTATITAYTSDGKVIDQAVTCPFKLTPEIDDRAPKLNIGGRLTYSFNKTQYPGANNASITLQIVDKAMPQFSDKYSQIVSLDETKNQVSVTTDNDGNFTAQLPLAAADTGSKYVLMRINNQYYAPLANNIAVKIPRQDHVTVGNEVVVTQDTLKLGNIQTGVYNYALKVTLKKGFPQQVTQGDFDALGGDPQVLPEAGGIMIDNSFINSTSSLPAGITVQLYRKTKTNDVPFYEGDGRVVNDYSLHVKVAEAKTTVSPVGVTFVNFSNLLGNFVQGDEYYLQALLPDNLIDNPDELAGPPQKQVYTPAIYNGQTTDYSAAVTYFVISAKPPMARVKGKAVYQWPSAPGVLHPYANQPFEITMHTETNSGPNTQTVNCQTFTTVLMQTSIVNGVPIKTPVAPGPDNIVVGRGVTDAQGNFDVPILDFMQMGEITGLTRVAVDKPSGPTCDEQAAAQKGAQREVQKLANGAGAVANTPAINGGAPNEDIGMQNGGVNALVPAPLNNALNMLKDAGAIGGLKDVGAAAVKAVSGPAAETGEALPDDNIGYTNRTFSITFDDKTVSFVVQPFGTVDVGVITTNINEVPDTKINIYANGQKNNTALYGARVVVFRSTTATGVKVPDGEGSVSHPVKKLMSSNFAGGQVYGKTSFDTPVEWIIDTTLNVNLVPDTNYGTINLGGRRLWGKYLPIYSLQVIPSPEGGGGNFAPQLVSLPIQNFSKDTIGGDAYEYSNSTYNNKKLGVAYKYLGASTKYDAHGIYVDISPSRIAGRVMDASSLKGLKDVTINLHVNTPGNNGSFKIANTTITTVDTSGYFEVTNGDPNFSWGPNAEFEFFAVKVGYNTGIVSPTTITDVGNNYYYPLSLTPSSTLYISTRDPVTKMNVPVYALRDDGTIFTQIPPTKLTGYMIQMPVSGNVNHQVTIYPINPKYFDTTVTYTPANYGPNNYLYLISRHHRMQFTLADNTGRKLNALTTPLKIIINNDITKVAKREANGNISFDFENVSVNNYNIQVIDTAGSGYIPIVFNLKNEESRAPIAYTIKMTKGLAITGHVTLAKGNTTSPLKNARVYIDYNWQPDVDYGSNASKLAGSQLETYSLADGSYKLTGVPANFALGKLQVTMHATLQSDNLTTGDEQTVPLTLNGPNTADFKLTTVDGVKISKIWGYPLTIEKSEPVILKGAKGYKITGVVDLSTNTSQFTSFDPKGKIRVTDVVFNANLSGEYEPTVSSVPLDAVLNMKMRYLNKYNVVLKNADNSQPLMLERNAGAGTYGSVKATVSIVDNSFNYPSTYLSFQDTIQHVPIPFYLFNKSEILSASQPVLRAINNDPAGKGVSPVYNLSDSVSKPLKFLFIGFPATANTDSSFVDAQGKFNLNVYITANIPNSNQGTIGVHIKKLILDGNTINPTTSDEPIIANLQTWTLQINDWTIDPQQGGIVSKNAYVKTGIVDIKANTFNLRHDLFVLKDFDVSNISLGSGLLNLTNIDTAGTHLVFDEACGSDHGKHWRFAAINSKGGPVVATIPIPAVQDKIAAVTLNVSYFQLVSYNNENIVSLSGDQSAISLYNNAKFTFVPQFVTSSTSSFSLGGAGNIGVPRIGNIALNLLYTQDANKKFDVNPGNLGFGFEGKGYVQFHTAPNAVISQNTFITSIPGSVQEPDKINPIPCVFSFGAPVNGTGTPDNGTITLQKNYKLQMDGPSNVSAADNVLSLTIANADGDGMLVGNAADWGTLKFSGPMNDPQSGAMVATPIIYKFEVLGDIQADASGITMNQATPLGNVHMTYTFATRTLYGILNMKDVKFGTYNFNGTVEMTYDPSGMIIVGTGSLNTGVLFADGFGIFNIGVLFANGPLEPNNILTVTKYSTAPENICWLNDNKKDFKGFFITGGYKLIDEHDSWNAEIAAIYFDASLGIEASIGVNLAPATPNLMALIGAHGVVDAGLSSITGTSISGSLEAHLTGDIAYSQSGFSLKANAGVELKYTISQYIPLFGTKSISGSKGAGVAFGVNPSLMKFSLDPNVGTVDCKAAIYSN